MIVLCAGTGTEVGKTWVGAAVLRVLAARGVRVAARKPVQSFAPGEVTDAAVLAAASGEDPSAVCECSYPVAMAPPIAATLLGLPVPTLNAVAAVSWPSPTPDVCWVESVGGVRSPIAVDGDTVDLAALLRPDRVVLVADAGLGTINAVRLSVDALAGFSVIVYLNRFSSDSAVHTTNRSWLASRCALDVVTAIEDLADRVG